MMFEQVMEKIKYRAQGVTLCTQGATLCAQGVHAPIKNQFR